MTRPRVLVIIALLLVLLLQPWTWAAHRPGNLGPTLIALGVIALVIYACAVRLGDLPSPMRRSPPQPRQPREPRQPRQPRPRTASDVTRAAEELLRANRRRQP